LLIKRVIPYKETPLDFAAEPSPLAGVEISGNRPVGPIVEIGFGTGDATVSIAERFPQNMYLGIEVFEAGVGKLLSEIEKRNIKNVCIIKYDAVPVVRYILPNNSIAGFHIFFPDPWPKKKHRKRRLLQRPFTNLLAQKLLPAGYIHFVTDWAEYAECALTELSATPSLCNRYMDFAPPNMELRPITKFEKKAAKEGREIKELFFYKADFSDTLINSRFRQR
jgi:tRNA (guanine-N7-)-methyltransferase